MGENCLTRETVKSIARGRSPKKELTAARRHLADCPRCRAAVVAAAHGIEGPGDTVLLKRSGGAVSKTLKVVAVSASILATGAAWRYGTAPKAEPPRDARSSLEPAASAAGSTEEQPARAKDGSSSSTWQRSVTVQQLGAPAPEPEPVSELTPPEESSNPQPTVRVLNASASEPPPTRTDEYWRTLDPVAAPTKRAPRPTPARPASHSTTRPASSPPEAAKAEKKSDEYDFGIDEPAPKGRDEPAPKGRDEPAPKGRKSTVRTSLD